MPVIHRGATLRPHFRDFLPEWIARQPWYQGSGVPSLRPVGFYRLEDPAGQVGIEAHLVHDGQVLYQIPMTYRGAPRDGAREADLIATAEHSVLGTRWIYDGTTDPVWAAEVLHLVRDEAVAERSIRPGVGVTEAFGRRLTPWSTSTVVDWHLELAADTVVIDARRVLDEGDPPDEPGLVGMLMGSWQPDGADGPTAHGWLALMRSKVRQNPARGAGAGWS